MASVQEKESNTESNFNGTFSKSQDNISPISVITDIEPFLCHICGCLLSTLNDSVTHVCNEFNNSVPHISKEDSNNSLPHVCTDACADTCTEAVRFKCLYCYKTFATHYNVKRHIINVHTGDIKYNCRVSSQSFNTNSNLNMHMQGHPEENSNNNLIMKQNRLCPYCKKSFSQGSFRKHLRTHTGEKLLYKCHQCAESFIKKETLKSHMEKHTKVNVYESPFPQLSIPKIYNVFMLNENGTCQNVDSSSFDKQNVPQLKIPQAIFLQNENSTCQNVDSSSFGKQNVPQLMIPQATFLQNENSTCQNVDSSSFGKQKVSQLMIPQAIFLQNDALHNMNSTTTGMKFIGKQENCSQLSISHYNTETIQHTSLPDAMENSEYNFVLCRGECCPHGPPNDHVHVCLKNKYSSDFQTSSEVFNISYKDASYKDHLSYIQSAEVALICPWHVHKETMTDKIEIGDAATQTEETVYELWRQSVTDLN